MGNTGGVSRKKDRRHKRKGGRPKADQRIEKAGRPPQRVIEKSSGPSQGRRESFQAFKTKLIMEPASQSKRSVRQDVKIPLQAED